jgi:hypothetical protein
MHHNNHHHHSHHHAAKNSISGGALDLHSACHLLVDFLENVGASTSHNPMSLHDLLQG